MDKLRLFGGDINRKTREVLRIRQRWEPKDTHQSLEVQPEDKARLISALLTPLLRGRDVGEFQKVPTIGEEGFQALIAVTMRNDFRNWLFTAAKRATRKNDIHYREITHESGAGWERVREVYPSNPSAGSNFYKPEMGTDSKSAYIFYYSGESLTSEHEESIRVQIRQENPAPQLTILGDNSTSTDFQVYTFSFYKDDQGNDEYIAIQFKNYLLLIDRSGTVLTQESHDKWYAKPGRKPPLEMRFIPSEGLNENHTVVNLLVRRDQLDTEGLAPKAIE